MRIYALKANYQTNPIGIDLNNVTLSWKVKEAKGRHQQYSRITVAEDWDFQKVIYDSGEVPLRGAAFPLEAPLKPGQPYFWKVEVMDDQGDYGVSSVSSFEGGHPEEAWHGIWIKPPFVREIHPVFSKTFVLNKETLAHLAMGRLYICSLGLYEVVINGVKAGDEFLAPYWTDYRYWIQYQTYDVAPLLREGENRIDISLGNGWYKGRFGYLNKGQLREYYGDEFKVVADLYLTDKEGKQTVIATDETWLALKSPVVSSGIYDGEVYDARMEPALWEIPERQRLKACPAQAPEGKLCPMTGPAVKKKEVLKVKEIITTSIGETVLDFGQEITGWVTFWPEGPKGQRITLQHGEVLQNGIFYRENLRTAQAEYTFISNGIKQFARPHFTFFGFRYVKVTGMEVNSSNVDQFQAWALYSDMQETGFIETSNEKINRLIENTKWSEKDNFLDVPTDCPQRDERLGWTGDAQIFSSAACYHMEPAAFFRKYLRDMAYEQREKGGAVPYVVPDVLTLARQMNGEPEFPMEKDLWGEAGASVWGDAATIIPWNLYVHTGNRKWLGEQYDNMKQWSDFMIHMDETYCGGERLWTCGFHFGDWLSLDAEGDSREGGTDKYFVASVFYMYSTGLTARAAHVLGNQEEEAYYGKISAQIKEAIKKRYFCGNGRIKISTQTAYVLGLWFGLFDVNETEAAAEELCRLLEERKMHLATGFVGTGYLCQALSQAGRTKEAYTLLFNEDYPSWLYEVNLGATTIWERWNSLLPDGSISSTGMNSLNHYAYGVVAEWIYSTVCGLSLCEDKPAGEQICFAPRPDRRLDYVKAKCAFAAGEYEAGWKWENGFLVYSLSVPFDCHAVLDLGEGIQAVEINGEPVKEYQGLVLEAGRYEIKAFLTGGMQ